MPFFLTKYGSIPLLSTQIYTRLIYKEEIFYCVNLKNQTYNK